MKEVAEVGGKIVGNEHRPVPYGAGKGCVDLPGRQFLLEKAVQLCESNGGAVEQLSVI